MQRPRVKKVRISPKYKKIIIIAFSALFVLLLGGAYIAYTKRQAILNREIAKAKATAKADYNLDIEIGSADFTGLSTVDFSNITVVPAQRDSLLSIKKLEVSIRLWPLVFGNVKLASVVLQNAHLNLTDINHIKNFDFLFKKKKDTISSQKADLSELSYNLINQVLYKVPDNLDVNNLLMTVKTDSSSFSMLTKTAVNKDGQLKSTIIINNGAATWHFDGRLRASDKDIDIKLYADGKKVELPYIGKRYGMKVAFDTVNTRLSKVENSGGETRIYGYCGVSNLLVHQARISSGDIIIPNAGIDANLFIGENYVSLDSSSTITLKKVTARPFIKYTLNPVKIYEVKLNTGWVDAQDLFDSFPEGIFDSLTGIQVAGKLNYSLNIDLNAAHPDDVVFDSRLDKQDFRIIRYGKTDLSKLNRTFVYTPYEYGKPMPSRVIGPSNPYFTPLSDISPNLQYAVMTAEDPSFYSNHGFVEESIRKSLATDFKEKKFKRGGSTISMQLVKNAFLSREKTLARKAEEILIVWLIENDQIMTKDRMLEVYFNIIEWGDNIYGIGEASRYYFDKTPAELTIGESIYLASIVPHPKTGLYSFQPDGTLRPYLVGYFNLIGNLMAGHGRAQLDSNSYGFYTVRLKESLRKEAPIDTAKADSLIRQDQEQNDDAAPAIVPAPEKRTGILQRLFGKKDTLTKKTVVILDPKAKLKADIKKLKEEEQQQELLIDTAGKTRKDIRQEKRRLREAERAQEKALKQAANQ
jgi:hypothetical protein